MSEKSIYRKSRIPTLLAVLGATAICLILILKSREPTDEKSTTDPEIQTSTRARPASAIEPYEITDPSVDLDTLAREVPPEIPRATNQAGHTIIASADTSNPEKTDALLKSFARGKAHLEHMRRENAFVKRRQIVELSETFADFGERIRNGEEIKTLEIPAFDGETYTMVYDPTLMGPDSATAGTLIGGVQDKEASDVILGYYNGFTSAYVNIPTQNTVLEYMTVGGNQIVVKEIDLDARNIAEPCLRCNPEAGGHSPHPAGWAHELSTKNKQTEP